MDTKTFDDAPIDVRKLAFVLMLFTEKSRMDNYFFETAAQFITLAASVGISVDSLIAGCRWISKENAASAASGKHSIGDRCSYEQSAETFEGYAIALEKVRNAKA